MCNFIFISGQFGKADREEIVKKILDSGFNKNEVFLCHDLEPCLVALKKPTIKAVLIDGRINTGVIEHYLLEINHALTISKRKICVFFFMRNKTETANKINLDIKFIEDLKELPNHLPKETEPIK